MKILILNWRDNGHLKAGGAELVTMEHAKGWVECGHSVTWLTSFYKGAKKDEIIDGVYMMRRSGSLLIYVWGFFYTLFRGQKYDVIIDEIHAIPFFTPLSTKTKKIAFIHEVAGQIWDYMAPFPLNKIGKMFERFYFPLYRHIPFWTDAPSTINELNQMGIPKKNIIAIPCPISRHISLSKGKKELTPTFIFVSRVVAMKGIEDVIKAFGFIVKELQHAKLYIVGGGEESYLNSLKKLIREHNLDKSIIFLGKVNENKKIEYMNKSHILLHASIKEGWGLVVLEAASQGTPAVVYNVAGLRDVVKNKKTGIVLENNSPQHLAFETIKLYNDKKRYKKYQEEGLNWVTSLTWDYSIKQSEELLQKVVSS